MLQIGLNAIYPPLLPEVRVVEFKSSEAVSCPDRAVVVIRVNESDVAPHAVDDRTSVYLRVDNISDVRERRATIGELEWLVNKRQKSAELKQRLLTSSSERANEIRDRRRARSTRGTYRPNGEMKLYTIPTFPRAPLLDTRKWLEIVREVKIEIPAAPHSLPDGNLQRIAGGLFFDGSYSYSEFEQHGLMYHEVDYFWEYYGPSIDPGAQQLLPGVTAAWIWGVLESSRQIYLQANFFGSVDFQLRATGVKNSIFVNRDQSFLYDPRKLIDSQLVVQRRFRVQDLENELMQIAHECQRELYWAYGIDALDSLINHDFTNCGRGNSSGRS